MGAFHGLNSLFTGLLYTIVVVGGGYFVGRRNARRDRFGHLRPVRGHLHGAGRAAHQLHQRLCRRATRASAASSRYWPSGPTWPPSPARPPWPRPAAARCAALWITAT
ncbi:MAG: hypothetical protein ACLTDR_15660 [Adlercreutzia equolifaciens]